MVVLKGIPDYCDPKSRLRLYLDPRHEMVLLAEIA